MIEVSFCTEQQLVETVTPSREHPVHLLSMKNEQQKRQTETKQFST